MSERTVVTIPSGTATGQVARLLQACAPGCRVRGEADGAITVYTARGAEAEADTDG